MSHSMSREAKENEVELGSFGSLRESLQKVKQLLMSAKDQAFDNKQYVMRYRYDDEKKINNKLTEEIEKLKEKIRHYEDVQYLRKNSFERNKQAMSKQLKYFIDKLVDQNDVLKGKLKIRDYQITGLQKNFDQLLNKNYQLEKEILKYKKLFNPSDQHIKDQKQINDLRMLLEKTRKVVHSKDQEIIKLRQILSEAELELKKTEEISTTFKDNRSCQKEYEIEKTWFSDKTIRIDSQVIQTNEEVRRLYKMLSDHKEVSGFKLLFRASDYGFNVCKSNKEKYCGVPHTVLLVKTKEQGKIIGAYTPLKWKIDRGVTRTESQDCSGKTFLFSISNNHKLSLRSPLKQAAIYHQSGYGPWFSGGIEIHNRSDTESTSCALPFAPLRYEHPEYKGNDKESWRKFVGSPDGHFSTIQWEVHMVIFEE